MRRDLAMIVLAAYNSLALAVGGVLNIYLFE